MQNPIQLFNRLSVSGKLVVVTGLSVAALLLVASLVLTLVVGGMARDQAFRTAQAESEAAVAQVRAELRRAEAVAEGVAATVEAARAAGVTDRVVLGDLIKPYAGATEIVFGSWYMSTPNGWDGKDADFISNMTAWSTTSGAVSVYWTMENGQRVASPEPDDAFADDYYALPMQAGRRLILEPYPDTVGGKTVLMTSIVRPVTADGAVIGVAGVDIGLDTLAEGLGKLHPLDSGRVMLLSAKGLWVSHPDAARRLRPYADAGREQVLAALADGKPVHIADLKDDGRTLERLVTPVALDSMGARWLLVVDVPSDAVFGASRRLAMGLALGGLLIVAAVLGVLLLSARTIVRDPLERLVRDVARLRSGDYEAAVRAVGRQDEVGAIAGALDEFRHELADGVRRRAEQERERAAAEAARRAHASESEAVAAERAHAVGVLAEGMERLAGGDLVWRMDENGFAPVDRKIPADFNAAVGALDDTMAGIIDATQSIRTGCDEISRAADDLSQRTERQAAGIEETAATLDQITATVKQTAQRVARARSVTSETWKGAEQGGEVMRSAVTAMNQIEASSQQISQIIGVIDEIAFQTNLLALNAGVEAARAGESGKGFAVVASEVRALAQRSAEAAKEIKDLIFTSSGEVEQGVRLVVETGQTLDRIVRQVAEINDLISEIAAAAQEQAVGLTEVNAAVNQMDQVTQQNAAMVEQSTAASHTLSKEAGELERLIRRFKVHRTAAPPAPAVRPVRARMAGGGAPAAAPAGEGWTDF